MNRLNTNILFAALTITVAFISASVVGNENFVLASNYDHGTVSQISHNYLSNCLSDNGGDGDTQFEPLGCSLDADNIHVSTYSNDKHSRSAVNIINHNMDMDNNYAFDQYGFGIEDPDQVGWD